MLHPDFLNDNATFDSKYIEIWKYPGYDFMRIFKHPASVHEDLKTLKMLSKVRPYDCMLSSIYGHGYESPGYIITFSMWSRLDNEVRIQNFSKEKNVPLRILSAEEFENEYSNVYDKRYPDNLILLEPSYDFYTTKRLRHMYYFNRHRMPSKVQSFVVGIGKKLGAGHLITLEQRAYIKSLLQEYNNQEQHVLEGAYRTIEEFKLPF